MLHKDPSKYVSSPLDEMVMNTRDSISKVFNMIFAENSPQ